MSRLLFLLAVAGLIYWMLKSSKGGARKDSPPARGDSGYTEDMVRCIYCGVHLPRSESIMSGGKFYCCEAHRLAHQSPPDKHDAG